jgi:PEP-CTERM motif
MINIRTLVRLSFATALLSLAAASQAVTVYCPNGSGGSLTAPTSGRYVAVSNGSYPGSCYYQSGNLQSTDIAALGLTTVDKNGTSGSSPGALLASGFVGGSTSGTWQMTSNLWTSYTNLYLGFHFGNGSGDPDSFVVQLEQNKLSGSWSLNAIAPAGLNGLSNYYLLTGPGTPPPPGRVSEPGTLALAGLALLAGATLRRRAGQQA